MKTLVLHNDSRDCTVSAASATENCGLVAEDDSLGLHANTSRKQDPRRRVYIVRFRLTTSDVRSSPPSGRCFRICRCVSVASAADASGG